MSSKQKLKRKSVSMQKRKKQLLGAVGLAAVVAMTAVAVSLPSPEAEAKGYEAVVRVTVGGGGPDQPGTTASVSLFGIFDQGEVVTDTSKIQGTSAAVTTVTLTGSYKDKSGKVVTFTVAPENLQVSTTDGGFEFEIDWKALGIPYDAEVTLVATGKTTDGRSVTDSVRFYYRAATMQVNVDEKDKLGNPQVEIEFNSSVKKMELQVYDKQGNPVFVDSEGKPKTIILKESDLDYDTLKHKLYLPMAEYNAASGDYDLVLVAYDADGNVLSMNTKTFKYERDTPEIPNTGSLLGDLNISRADYLITGLIAFGAVMAFAIYLMIRRQKR